MITDIILTILVNWGVSTVTTPAVQIPESPVQYNQIDPDLKAQLKAEHKAKLAKLKADKDFDDQNEAFLKEMRRYKTDFLNCCVLNANRR